MSEPKTLKQLRDIADLNLCEKCIPVYEKIIEPNIKPMIGGYFYYWKDMEWRVTVLVMQLEGVFKKKGSILIDFESSEEAKRYSDEIDPERWNEINRFNFERKLKYLYKKGILGKSSYNLLETLRKNRNKKMHRPYKDFGESDMIEFSYGAHIVQNIWLTIFAISDSDIIENMRKSAEKQAEVYLAEITKREPKK